MTHNTEITNQVRTLDPEVEAMAIKWMVSFQVDSLMKERELSKAALAKQMRTSRSSLDRLLDPTNTSITLHTLERAAQVLGKRLKIEFA